MWKSNEILLDGLTNHLEHKLFESKSIWPQQQTRIWTDITRTDFTNSNLLRCRLCWNLTEMKPWSWTCFKSLMYSTKIVLERRNLDLSAYSLCKAANWEDNRNMYLWGCVCVCLCGELSNKWKKEHNETQVRLFCPRYVLAFSAHLEREKRQG